MRIMMIDYDDDNYDNGNDIDIDFDYEVDYITNDVVNYEDNDDNYGDDREENGIIEIERAIDKLSRHHIR